MNRSITVPALTVSVFDRSDGDPRCPTVFSDRDRRHSSIPDALVGDSVTDAMRRYTILKMAGAFHTAIVCPMVSG